MKFLKTLPISYTGTLHNVKLINFSVDVLELQTLIPDKIAPRLINGRAMISMVVVDLKQMTPAKLPFRFSYKHVAFRLLVDDTLYAHEPFKGIFFIRSFTNKTWVVKTGKYLTSYNLEKAEIYDDNHRFDLMTNTGGVHFDLGLDLEADSSNTLFKNIQRIDRAYSVVKNDVFLTEITRKEWPIKSVECNNFHINIFKTARIEGAFKIDKPIEYKWNRPRKVFPERYSSKYRESLW